MLRSYSVEGDHLVRTELAADAEPAALAGPRVVWLDLLQPTPQEVALVDGALRIATPTREEAQEIEYSSRLYAEDGAEYLTVSAVTPLDADEPQTTPITFIVKGQTLVTVRYADPKPFAGFAVRAIRGHGIAVGNGQLVMLGLLEAMVDRIADALERVGGEVDALSRGVFRRSPGARPVATRNLQGVIEQIGRKGEVVSMVRESLVSLFRMLSFHTAADESEKQQRKELRGRVRELQRDITSLTDHATFLSGKINFLLDATLGLINLEQNQIIKIFSVAAVVFLPPTLVASIYGMNFENMPELKWLLGYPWAILLMILSAALPFLYFKKRGWL